MLEILHITPRAGWEQAVSEGEYRSDDLATEGFIHCLTLEQLPYVYGKFYKDRTGLVVLRIDFERLKCPLRWAINLDAVDAVVEIEDALSGYS